MKKISNNVLRKKRYRKVLTEKEYLNAYINWLKGFERGIDYSKKVKGWEYSKTMLEHAYKKAAAEHPELLAKMKKEESELRKKYGLPNMGNIDQAPNFEKLLESRSKKTRTDLKKMFIYEHMEHPATFVTPKTTMKGDEKLMDTITNFVLKPLKTAHKSKAVVTVVGTGINELHKIESTQPITYQPYEIKEHVEKQGMKCQVNASELSKEDAEALEKQREKLGKAGENIRFGQLDIITGTPIKSDAIIMTQVLRYFPTDKIKVAVQNAADALNKNGKLILTEDIDYDKLIMLQHEVKGLKLIYKPPSMHKGYEHWVFKKR